MSSQPAQQNNEEATQEEESTPLNDEEKLVQKLEPGGFEPEQAISLQASLALLFGATTHTLEIRDSIKLLRSEIDVNKLITDPQYKALVERAVQLTNKYGRLVKKGDLLEITPRVEQALARVEILHGQTREVKTSMSSQYEIELRSTYRLNDDQIKNIKENALARITENPSLSMRDALRIEAREVIVKTVEKEVKDDKNIKKSDWKKEIEKRLDAKDKAFLEHKQTAKVYDVEKELCDKLNNRGSSVIKDTLGKNVHPPSPAITPSISIPRSSVYIPSIPLPPGLAHMFKGLGNMFGGLGTGGIGSFLNSGLKSMFGSGGLLSKGISGGLNLAKSILPKLASFALPPLGAALTAITAIDTLTGGLFTKGAAILVGSVAAIVIVLPIIIGIGVFSSVTGDKPMVVTSTNYRDLGWNEFSNQYLTINPNKNEEKLVVVNTNQLSWQRFEKDYLILQKQYLSLEKINQ